MCTKSKNHCQSTPELNRKDVCANLPYTHQTLNKRLQKKVKLNTALLLDSQKNIHSMHMVIFSNSFSHNRKLKNIIGK